MSDVTPTHNPDVLDCLANLSNDEVFTPPRVANAMLDLLPRSLFQDPNVTFLDPCCKSGVFLREIAKRLLVGLEPTFPNLQARLDHILRRQLFGLAITELTALTSRRTLYCSKVADGKYALSHFDTPEGNILFPETRHEWVNGRCRLCGVSQDTLKDRKETHAYAFIHGINPERLFKMKFDVIIGNPPYQFADAGESTGASPIYQLFVEAAKRLQPEHLVIIIPSRWFAGGKGLGEFREAMLHDRRMQTLHDFLDAKICFGNEVEIKGGVCYFHWEKKHNGPCHIVTHSDAKTFNAGDRYLLEPGVDTFIRHHLGVSVYHKVKALGEPSFETLVSARKPFGFDTTEVGVSQSFSGSVAIYRNGGIGYIARDRVMKNPSWLSKWKLYISKAYGAGEVYPHQILGVPLLGEPGSCCSETYIVIGPFDNREVALNVRAYLATRFFRFMVFLKKITQDATARVYQLVPLQDFSGEPWTDEALYAKYGLSAEKIAFIEAMVKPMEV